MESMGMTAEEVMADTETLSNILSYHVLPVAATSDMVVGMESATTIESSDISIEVTDNGVVLNGNVNVTATDIHASNGVIHLIDAVLMPPE